MVRKDHHLGELIGSEIHCASNRLGKARHMEVEFLGLPEAIKSKRIEARKIADVDDPSDGLTEPKSYRDVARLLQKVGAKIAGHKLADEVGVGDFSEGGRLGSKRDPTIKVSLQKLCRSRSNRDLATKFCFRKCTIVAALSDKRQGRWVVVACGHITPAIWLTN